MRIVVVIGDVIGNEWCLPKRIGFKFFAQAGFNAFSVALANISSNHVFGKWIEQVADWL